MTNLYVAQISPDPGNDMWWDDWLVIRTPDEVDREQAHAFLRRIPWQEDAKDVLDQVRRELPPGWTADLASCIFLDAA